MKITGVIEQQGFGLGTWALVAGSGETYELKDAPPELCQAGITVTVDGTVRNDVMTVAMVGPVLEVTAFERLK